jgi:hypothetical protein
MLVLFFVTAIIERQFTSVPAAVVFRAAVAAAFACMIVNTYKINYAEKFLKPFLLATFLLAAAAVLPPLLNGISPPLYENAAVLPFAAGLYPYYREQKTISVLLTTHEIREWILNEDLRPADTAPAASIDTP